MSEWSVALDKQVRLWRRCAPFTSWEDLREHAWELTNLDGEIRTPDEIIHDERIQDVFYHLLKIPPSQVPPYYFNLDACRLLAQAGTSYPLTASLPSAACYLTDSGFWYFTHPIADAKALDDHNRALRMILWLRSERHKLLVFVALIDDPDAPLPLVFGTWPYDTTIKGSLDDNEGIETNGADWRDTQQILQSVMQYLAAGVSFCHQRIFLDTPAPADRAARRRAVAEGIEVPSDVHVIRLRRATTAETNGEPRDTDWNFRWWVRGHWRQQPMGVGRSERIPTWINAYVKGPDDKPMKPLVPTVFNVVR